MTTKKKQPAIPQFEKQPPQYRFFFNPYQDMRWTKCPMSSVQREDASEETATRYPY